MCSVTRNHGVFRENFSFRRRENISELGDVLETLQSAFPRRQSLPVSLLLVNHSNCSCNCPISHYTVFAFNFL